MMTVNKSIKPIIFVFIVALVLYTGTFLYLFKKNYDQFNAEIFQRSKDNIEIIDLLSKVETNLYIHKKSLFRFINTGDPTWKAYLKDAEKGIDRYFEAMEVYNNRDPELTSLSREMTFGMPKKDLEKQIIELQKGLSGNDQFQRLFFLVRQNLKQYFMQSDELVKEYNTVGPAEQKGLIAIDSEEAYANLIFVGIDHLVTVYNNYFWDKADKQNLRYAGNNTFYFRALLVSSVIVVLFAIMVVASVFKYFYHKEEQNKNLSLLGTKDLMTGLFNRSSFELFCSQELDRAKRKGAPLCLLTVRLDAYEKIREALGEVAFRHTMHQVSEILQQTFRAYDGIFRYDDNTFITVFSETNFNAINAIVARLQKRFYKTLKMPTETEAEADAEADAESASPPSVKYGFALYPTNAETLELLVQFAISNLTDKFDAFTTQSRFAESHLVSKEDPVTPEGLEDQFTDNRALAGTPHHELSQEQQPVSTGQYQDIAPWLKEEIQKAEGTAVLDDMFEKTPNTQPLPAPSGDHPDTVPPVEGLVTEAQGITPAGPPAAEFVHTGPSDTGQIITPEKAAVVVNPEDAPIVQGAAHAQNPVSENADQSLQSQMTAKPDDTKTGTVDDIINQAMKDRVESASPKEKISSVAGALRRQESAGETGADPALPGQALQTTSFMEPTEDDDVSHIASIEVVTPGDGEDVIMVDFESEQDDLAINFRKKIKQQRKKA
ncbi:MAG: diguanylate cyclase [Deltaproteobacteria bacterium]|nr:diguanylate cyclase [Deltaproteobacteria bacterium]